MKSNWLVVALIALSACGTTDKDYDDKMILRYNESAGISNLDPAHSERFEDIWAMSQIYNGLIRLDSDMKIVPDLAKEWEMDSSRMTYTFHLRTDAIFQDSEGFEDGKGRKVVAEDFIHSFQRILDPEEGSQGKFIFKNIDRLATQNHLGMEAPNDSTLVIHLKKPQHSFLKMLTLSYCYVVPIEVADYFGDDFTRNPVGTGPFQMKVWRQGDKLVLVKNEEYHEFDDAGERLPYLDAISISFIRSRSTEFTEFSKGNLDFISGIDDSYQNSVLTASGELKDEYQDKFYMLKQPWLKTDYIVGKHSQGISVLGATCWSAAC